jgi:hypothetical protein
LNLKSSRRRIAQALSPRPNWRSARQSSRLQASEQTGLSRGAAQPHIIVYEEAFLILEAVQRGRAHDAGPDGQRWLRAFADIQWTQAGAGGLALTAAGLAALKDMRRRREDDRSARLAAASPLPPPPRATQALGG